MQSASAPATPPRFPTYVSDVTKTRFTLDDELPPLLVPPLPLEDPLPLLEEPPLEEPLDDEDPLLPLLEDELPVF